MRVALFFDGNNFYGGWRETAAPTRVEFQALARWLVQSVGGTELVGAWYYTGVDKGEPTETANLESRDRLEGFLTMLEHQPGYFVRRFPRVTRTTSCSSCGAEHTFSQEKGVDTTMVADMIRLAAAGAFDAMVLVTGDADHAPGLVAVRELGRRALVATWGGYGLSHWLRAEAWVGPTGCTLFTASFLLQGFEMIRLLPPEVMETLFHCGVSHLPAEFCVEP